MSAGCVFGLRGTHAGSGVELTFDARAVVFDTDRALIAEDRDLYTDVYVAELTAPSAAYAFAVKPLSVDFGERPLGSAVTRNFWLSNKGTTALPLLRVFVRGEDVAMFTVAHACGVLIAPGTGCTIAVTFTPTVVGSSTTKVVVVAGNRQVRERVVLGTGVQSP
jgi:hypothetical protein